MQRFPLFVALAGLALASSVLLARAAGRQVRHGPLYTVAQVQAGLAHQRGIWVGRTVRVRGSAVLCLSSDSQRDPQRCSRWPTYLVTGDAGGASGVLPLTWGHQDDLPAFLHRVLPFAGLVPAAKAVHWGVVATYQVQLRAAPAGSCTIPPCYQALLLDAAPAALLGE
jgi:hypothetical protein